MSVRPSSRPPVLTPNSLLLPRKENQPCVWKQRSASSKVLVREQLDILVCEGGDSQLIDGRAGEQRRQAMHHHGDFFLRAFHVCSLYVKLPNGESRLFDDALKFSFVPRQR